MADVRFKNLGPLLEETRTQAICEICKNYIYKQIYYDENSKSKRKTIFVCKNCYNNNNNHNQ